MHLCLAAGLSIGAGSLVYFFWAVLGGVNASAYITLDTFLFAIVTFSLLRLVKNHQASCISRVALCEISSSSRTVRIACVLFWMTTLCAFAGLLFRGLRFQHGGADAISLWNLRAKFLVSGGCEWASSYAITFAHYPLLLSNSVARFWTFSFHDISTVAPIILAWIFSIAVIVLVVSALTAFRGRTHGCLGGLTLLSVAGFVPYGAHQQADIALSFLVLATIVLFAFHLSQLNSDTFIPVTLAGAMSGLAAWTKNEGTLFFVAVVLAHLALRCRDRCWRTYRAELFSFAMGALPVLSVLLLYQSQILADDDLKTAVATPGQEGVLQTFMDSARYYLTAKLFAMNMLWFGRGAIPIIILWFVFYGAQIDVNQLSRIGLFGGFVVGIVVLGLFVFHVGWVDNIEFFVRTSLYRRLYQIWPATVVLFFLCVDLATSNASSR